MPGIGPIAKFIIFFGVLMVIIGAALLLFDRMSWLGKLPGDIYIQRKNLTLYLPITTCIIISVMLSVILYFINKR